MPRYMWVIITVTVPAIPLTSFHLIRTKFYAEGIIRAHLMMRKQTGRDWVAWGDPAIEGGGSRDSSSRDHAFSVTGGRATWWWPTPAGTFFPRLEEGTNSGLLRADSFHLSLDSLCIKCISPVYINKTKIEESYGFLVTCLQGIKIHY